MTGLSAIVLVPTRELVLQVKQAFEVCFFIWERDFVCLLEADSSLRRDSESGRSKSAFLAYKVAR